MKTLLILLKILYWVLWTITGVIVSTYINGIYVSLRYHIWEGFAEWIKETGALYIGMAAVCGVGLWVLHKTFNDNKKRR